MKNIPRTLIPLLAFLALMSTAPAQEPGRREQFQVAVAFQKNATEDNARRLAELGKELDPLPSVPEEAEFHALKGAAFVKQAAEAAAFAKAAREFQAAVAIAPWVGEYYYNLAICEKSAGRFPASLAALKLAQILARDDKERHDCLALRADLEAAQELAIARKTEEDRIAQSPEVLAAKKRKQEEALIKSLDGVRFDCPVVDGKLSNTQQRDEHWLVIKGDRLAEWYKIIQADPDLVRAAPRSYSVGHLSNPRNMPIAGAVARDVGANYESIYQISADHIVLTYKTNGLDTGGETAVRRR